MNWPFIRRRRFLREIAELGQAYRWELDEVKRQVRRERARADELLRSFGRPLPPRCDDRTGEVMCMVRITQHAIRNKSFPEIAREIVERLVVQMLGYHNDLRGDLRETDAQRLLTTPQGRNA